MIRPIFEIPTPFEILSGWWLDVEEKTTASNNWIGCNFKAFRCHVFMKQRPCIVQGPFMVHPIV